MVRYPVRFVRVLLVFLPYVVAFARDRRRYVLFGAPRPSDDAEHRERARRLVAEFVDLGPAFIKFAQVLSTRPDLVPRIYAQEFATLQADVPPDPFEDLEPTVDADVGMETFEAFDRDPIAGGSLAQVHEARYDGRRVAVKVMRPNVEDLVETDLKVVRRVLPFVIAVSPREHRFSLRNIADDFDRVLTEELDFEREGRVMAAVRSNFDAADGDGPDVRVPRWYADASSERVLTMEYVDSTPITDLDGLRAAGFDPSAVATDVANAYFAMGLEHGLFHGDPHPGNLGIDQAGRVVFYDFGMTGEFTPEMQAAIIDLYLALAERDVDSLMDVLVDLGVLDPAVNRTALSHVLHLVIEDLEGRGGADWRQIITQAAIVLQEFPFRIPPNVMLVIRVGTVGEGVLRQLDPAFDILAAARRFLVKHGYMQRGVESMVADVRRDATASATAAVRLPSKLERVLDMVLDGELSIAGLRLEETLVPLGRLVAYALITAAWVVGSAILTDVSPVFGAVGFGIATALTAVFVLALRKAHRED